MYDYFCVTCFQRVEWILTRVSEKTFHNNEYQFVLINREYVEEK